MLSKVNSFYILIGILFITLLTVNNRYFKGSNAFLGVTYAKKYQINSEKSATIINTYVVPGQTVAFGDILVELKSPELELEIIKLEKEIENLTSVKDEKQKLLESELQLLDSKKRILSNEVDNEIEKIDLKITRNRTLSKIFTTADTATNSLSDLNLEKQSLMDQSDLQLEAIDIQIMDLKQDHRFDQSQIQANIDLIQQELQWRLEEQNKLNKYALFDGVVDDVHVKPGEQVDSFTSLLSINPIHSTTVVGFLVGSKDRNRQLGDVVDIQSLEQGNIKLKGKIIGFGSITELPEILQKSTAVKAFGLEVFIEINEENNLPIGEKVMIK